MFYQTMYILSVLILLSLLVIEINSQGTFVHSDLGGHILNIYIYIISTNIKRIKKERILFYYRNVFEYNDSNTIKDVLKSIYHSCLSLPLSFHFFFLFFIEMCTVYTITCVINIINDIDKKTTDHNSRGAVVHFLR